MKVSSRGKRARSRERRTMGRSRSACERTELEHTCWDPKDGELCLSRVKPEETLVEAHSGTDVQIVRQTWV